MSSARSSSAPDATSADPDEPRKKGARGGKRSVTHLSNDQLMRKRANDREAQRNIRQRTKEHIESLERQVKQLEQGTQAGSIDRVLARNRELEDEVEKLRSQVTIKASPDSTSRNLADIPEKLLVPLKVELDCTPGPNTAWGQTTIIPHIPAIVAEAAIEAEAVVSAPHTIDEVATEQAYMQAAHVTPIWDDPSTFGPQSVQSLTEPTPAWKPFHPTFSQPTRFTDPQTSGFTDATRNQNASFMPTTSWQTQPYVYTWQINTKLKAPATQIDYLILSVIQSQRHLARTQAIGGEDLVRPELPPVHMLFDQTVPVKLPTDVREVMTCYAQVLSKRGFAFMPEKLASFICMYRFIQWQIDPSNTNFRQLHSWQVPQPSQLEIAHPAWMDLPPWGKFRERVIKDQPLYDNAEFQSDYAANLCINLPDPTEAVFFESGQIKVSHKLDRHLSDIYNISMKKPFLDKYPEFSDVCRFDED